MNKSNWSDEKLISRLLNSKSNNLRWEIISILYKRPSKELFNKCLELINSNNENYKIIGIEILAQLGSTTRPFKFETLELYFYLLKNETNDNIISSTLYAISHNKISLNNEQIEILCGFYNHKNIEVKKGLTHALIGINHRLAIDTTILLSYDKNSYVRNWATFGLGTLSKRNNKKIREALWCRINDKKQETKYEAIVGLAKRKDKRINDIIEKELKLNNFDSLLLEAVTETKDIKFIPLLNQILESIKDDSNINKEWETILIDCIEELKKINTYTLLDNQ